MSKNYRYNYNYKRKKGPNWTFEIIVAVLAVILLCCAYAGIIDPTKFFPAPFMMLAFVPMLVLMLLLLVGAMFWRRWIAVAVIVVAVLASMPVTRLFVPYTSSEMISPEPADQSLILKVMTYNVLSFNYNEVKLNPQPSASMKLILDANPDVVLLQEGTAGGVDWKDIPSLAPFQAEVMARYPYCYYGTEGLNIMSKYPFVTHPVGEEQHARSPLGFNRNQISYVARTYDLQLPSGKQLRLLNFRLQSYHLSFGKSMNVRVSPDVKPSALERMRRSFALRGKDALTVRECIDNSPANLIVCGDMNDVTASHVYRVILGDDLNDVWNDVGNGYAYTYNRHNLYYRIDHILYRGDVRPFDAKRIKGGTSDHYPLMASFDIDITDKH